MNPLQRRAARPSGGWGVSRGLCLPRAPCGLAYDAWLFHPQIDELTDLARAFPGTTIVLNHCRRRARHRRLRRHGGTRSSSNGQGDPRARGMPQRRVKLGGLGMRINGFGFETGAATARLPRASRGRGGPTSRPASTPSGRPAACSRATSRSTRARTATGRLERFQAPDDARRRRGRGSPPCSPGPPRGSTRSPSILVTSGAKWSRVHTGRSGPLTSSSRSRPLLSRSRTTRERPARGSCPADGCSRAGAAGSSRRCRAARPIAQTLRQQVAGRGEAQELGLADQPGKHGDRVGLDLDVGPGQPWAWNTVSSH